jgi:selenocysteine-specific elongation factor
VQTKYRLGVVDRVERAGTAIVKGMFKKETNLELFIGRTVLAASGAKGTVIGSFGQSGKVRIEFEDRLASVSKDERIALVIQNCIFD